MNRALSISLFLIIIIFFSLIGIAFAEEFKEGIKINETQSIVNFSFDFSPIYVEDLIRMYPEITSITYNNGTQEIGYVNVFGGIGENFVITSNKIYEITSKQEVILRLE